MVNLPDVTVVAITTRDYGQTILAIKKTLREINPAEVLYFSDVPYESDDFQHVMIPSMNWDQYNEFVIKELGKYIETKFLLIIQHDGYVLNGSEWRDEFMEYDYIGAPWKYKDRNVGNGGFSMRSKRLHDILASDPFITVFSPEDEVIGRLYRKHLEQEYGISFAPENIAHKFSFELNRPWQKTFGFHAYHHEPYREPIILKRTGAMGDVIMLEPVMEYFHNKGYMVVLDTRSEYMNLFEHHFFPVYHVSQFDTIQGLRVINLDMSYEVNPREIVLKSYYKGCGITDGFIRNSRLNFPMDKSSKMFKKYVVIHVDKTDMNHRNIHADNLWVERLESGLKEIGYALIRIGKDNVMGGLWMNTATKMSLMYLIAGADLFVGIDSGPAQVAVALGVRSVLFFGSVDPKLRYPDMSNISVIQNRCPIGQNGCYHDVISVRGQECQVDAVRPPCITFDNVNLEEKIINSINDVFQLHNS